MSNKVHAFTNTPVKHNGNRYPQDAPITDEAAAKFLVMHGLARSAAAEPDPADAGNGSGDAPPPLTDDERRATIRTAMSELEAGNAEHFTGGGSGKPQVAALEAATGLEISADERDAIWAEVAGDGNS